jgi:hypothetical protein
MHTVKGCFLCSYFGESVMWCQGASGAVAALASKGDSKARNEDRVSTLVSRKSGGDSEGCVWGEDNEVGEKDGEGGGRRE